MTIKSKLREDNGTQLVRLFPELSSKNDESPGVKKKDLRYFPLLI
jgi:hypothetical protein